ncbi:MAG: creatininase family protein [Kiritimatiellaeota bacterium]|nr:creatininase family protein [Kiritimatiellota bacterium]
MIARFPELRSPEVRQAVDGEWLLVLPVGQTEEHGPHLPVGTDTVIVRRVCEAAIERLAGSPPACLMDAVSYGYSQRVLTSWPGTIVLRQEVVINVLCELIGSVADMGFRKIALVSGHGNHDGAVRVAARRAADACGIGPGVVFPHAFVSDLIRTQACAGIPGSCHAGEMETSVMLHLAPELVDLESAPAGDSLRQAAPFSSNQAFVSTWTRQKSSSGVYGDPTVATAAFGELLFERMVEKTAAFFRYYHGVPQV